jgi:hypothetical protein
VTRQSVHVKYGKGSYERGYRKLGAGTAVVLIHGGGKPSQDLLSLAGRHQSRIRDDESVVRQRDLRLETIDNPHAHHWFRKTLIRSYRE